MEAGGRQFVADVPVFAEVGGSVRETVAAEELPDHRVVGRPVRFRPDGRVEVLVDEQFGEGEEVEVDLVALDRPPVLLRDRLLDPVEVAFHIEVVLGRHFGQADGEVLLQLGFERQVRLDLVLRPGELEVLADVGPGEPHGDQDQRGAPLGGAVVGLVPAEDPEREVEDVDALFLDREAGLAEGFAEAEVERGEGQRGLELVVGVTGGGLVGVGDGFGEEGEEFGGDVLEGVGGVVGVRFLFLRGGEEVHDAFVVDEEAEEFTGEFVDDLDAAPLGGAEVEKGVSEGEVEDVAAGALEFVLDVVRWGHARSEVGEAVRMR